MPDGDPAIAPPHIDDGRSAAIIRRRHAHVVVLSEACPHRLYPVAAVLVRAAGIGPELGLVVRGGRRCPERYVCAVPGAQRHRLAGTVAMRHLENRKSGMALVELEAQGLLDS